MKTVKAWRQGDVVIVQAVLPKNTETVDHDGILAYGEVTGHKHQLVDGRVKYFRDGKGDLYFKVESRFVSLNHGLQPSVKSEGHFAHKLPAGTYRVIHQREADWASEATRYVKD